jgi:uncharacterized RDD family membrane protein YckC
MSGWSVDHPDDRLTEGVPTRRVLAWLIDMVLILLIISVLFVGLVLFGLVTFGFGLPLLGMLPVVPPLYHFLSLLSPIAATPGQTMLGLTVRRDNDLGKPTPLQAALSTIGFYLSLASGIGIICLLIALLTVRRRTLHDMLSGLVVIRTDASKYVYGSWNMPS